MRARSHSASASSLRVLSQVMIVSNYDEQVCRSRISSSEVLCAFCGCKTWR